MSYAPRPPMPICWGFEVGVVRVAWTRDPMLYVTGVGRVATATLVEIRTNSEVLPRGMLGAMLTGVVVRAPNGDLSIVSGIESFASAIIIAGTRLGLVLKPIEEP